MATLQQVVFKLDKEEYGLNIMMVNGIEKYQEVVKVPNAPEYIEGMINLRGEVLPIFSLRKKFNLADKPHDDETKIIVVNTNGIKVGFVVDSVEEILQIEEEVIEVAPTIVAGINRKYIKSVAKVDQRMIVLIDIDLVVTDEEKISLGEVIAEV
ncbi:chemotaxis protein CheW [Petrocella sp. FN5]|uniref:chemotaxis protein CheW n=1 Tax=Petrocella sp. FN5 TaxID=3032002 RepID=UPI0023DA0243|nr:chemotaxis protein CheW [Petrocella sp. FN5]MDF1615972.1 chemotaxis protein CheW [Petrocella sp. FN5]